MPDVNYDEKKSIITWKYDGLNQSLELKSADQYELDQSNGFIIVLTGTDSVPDSLNIIDAKDGSYRSFRPPSGFDFYYLLTIRNWEHRSFVCQKIRWKVGVIGTSQ